MPGERRSLKRTRTLKRRKGGSLIGHGVSGCVFKPALRCKGEATRREGKLSKLMQKNYAEEEFQQRTLFEPLNARQNYFVYPDDICEPETPFDPSNEVDKCEVASLRGLPDSDKRLLISEDGGVPLSNVRYIRPANMYQLFASLVNVFRGLIRIHNAGIVHMDVKPDNIVLRPTGSTFKTRLIDFGLSFKIDTLPAFVTIRDGPFYDYGIFMTDYVFWGPELRLVKPDYLNELYDRNILEQTITLKNKYPGRNISSEIVARTDEILINNDYRRYYKALDKMSMIPNSFFVGDKLLLNKDWVLDVADKLFELSDLERWNLVFKKTDVFGFGQAIIDIYTNCVNTIHVGYPMLAKELASASTKQLGVLYNKMTYPDPFSRLTMDEALNIYINDVLPELATTLRVSSDEIEAAKM